MPGSLQGVRRRPNHRVGRPSEAGLRFDAGQHGGQAGCGAGRIEHEGVEQQRHPAAQQIPLRAHHAHEFDELARARAQHHERSFQQPLPGRVGHRAGAHVEDQRFVGTVGALRMPCARRDAGAAQQVEPVLPAFDIEKHGAAEGQDELGVIVAVRAEVGAVAAHVEGGCIHGAPV